VSRTKLFVSAFCTLAAACCAPHAAADPFLDLLDEEPRAAASAPRKPAAKPPAGPTDDPNVTLDAKGREHVNQGKHAGQLKPPPAPPVPPIALPPVPNPPSAASVLGLAGLAAAAAQKYPTTPEQADLAITATVHAREMTFNVVGNATVEFPGNPERVTVWEAQRENFPRPVEPGVTYRNITVRLTILSRFEDIDRIVQEAFEALGVPPEQLAPAP
jgi:hypothetical protein